MKESHLASYISSHRKRAGLNQKELGNLLGYPDEGPVSRHERLRSIPPLYIALGYQAIFHVPVAELFPAAYDNIRESIEARLQEMRRDLEQSSAKGRQAARIARKLLWMWERENQEPTHHSYAEESQ